MPALISLPPLFVGTALYAAAIAMLTIYLAYIWRNSRQTALLQSFFAMHVLAILVLLGSYATLIAPTSGIKGACAGAAVFLQVSFVLASAFFGYHLWKERPLYYPVFFVIVLLSLVLALLWLFARELLNIPMAFQPLAMLLIFTLFFYGVIRFGLFDLLSYGILESLDMLQDQVLVLDKTGSLLYMNHATRALSEVERASITAACRNVICEGSRAFPPLPATGFASKKVDFVQPGKALWARVRPIPSILNRITGYVCIVHDDTEIVMLIDELTEKNRQLEEMNRQIKQLSDELVRLTVLQERNTLAQEIHDVLGHALHYALYVLESNRVIIDTDPAKALQRLQQAILHIDRGLDEIRTGFLPEHPHAWNGFAHFSRKLESLVKKYKETGVHAEIAALDPLSSSSERLFKALFRICQEALTNAIRHGAASQVIISVKREAGLAVLRIVDDGAGCTSVVKGGGLLSMEERVSELGGTIAYGGFDDGSGFQVQASIPLS